MQGHGPLPPSGYAHMCMPTWVHSWACLLWTTFDIAKHYQVAWFRALLLRELCCIYQTGGGMGSTRLCCVHIVVPYEVAGICALMLDAAATLGVGLPGVVQSHIVA